MMVSLPGTRCGRIARRRMAAIAAALFGMLFGHAAAEANYNGHYELADPKAKASRMFEFNVRQDGSRADVSFFTAMVDGSDDATDGTGKGEVEDGVLSFTLKDSFNNEITGTLQSAKGGYLLALTVTRVADPRPFHFYGNVVLRRTSTKFR